MRWSEVGEVGEVGLYADLGRERGRRERGGF